jgi:hypothetical protein
MAHFWYHHAPKTAFGRKFLFRLIFLVFQHGEGFVHSIVYIRSRDSVVGIATSYGLDDRGVGVRVPVGSLGSTQPPIQWVPGALSTGVNRPGREADHSPPTSAEVKKMWIYTSTPIRLHGVVLNQLIWGTTLPYLTVYIIKCEKKPIQLDRHDIKFAYN